MFFVGGVAGVEQVSLLVALPRDQLTCLPEPFDASNGFYATAVHAVLAGPIFRATSW